MLFEAGAGAGTAVVNLNKEREYEKIQEKLRKEFTEIDLNRDGDISKEEIIKFLNKKSKGIVDTQIAE